MRFGVIAISMLAVAAAQVARSEYGPGDQRRNRMAEPLLQRSGGALDIGGALSGIRQARQVVIRDGAAWRALWKEHSPAVPVPSVDFRRFHVVGVFAGLKPTGGYSVRIDRIDVHGKKAIVEATVIRPARGSMVTQMVTYPFAMRAVPRLPKEIAFHIAESERR